MDSKSVIKSMVAEVAQETATSQDNPNTYDILTTELEKQRDARLSAVPETLEKTGEIYGSISGAIAGWTGVSNAIGFAAASNDLAHAISEFFEADHHENEPHLNEHELAIDSTLMGAVGGLAMTFAKNSRCIAPPGPLGAALVGIAGRDYGAVVGHLFGESYRHLAKQLEWSGPHVQTAVYENLRPEVLRLWGELEKEKDPHVRRTVENILEVVANKLGPNESFDTVYQAMDMIAERMEDKTFQLWVAESISQSYNHNFHATEHSQ